MKRRVDPMRPPTDEHAHPVDACQARAGDAATARLAGPGAARGDASTARLAGPRAARGDASTARLAGAFLALADEPWAERPQRSTPRSLCALAAGVVLALAVPLAWMSPALRDQPAATVVGKAAGVVIDDEDADGPWPSA